MADSPHATTSDDVGAQSDARTWSRQLARGSILAAFLSCTLNCVFNQLASRAAATLGRFDGLIDWTSLLMVLAGMALGVAGMLGGWRRKSPDTMVIAGIGLVLNGGIVFMVIWYFTIVRR